MEPMTIGKNRFHTRAMSISRSCGWSRAVAAGRKARILKAIAPIQEIAATR